ncbi:hypothetical protein V5E97_17200 [Singulisphaera sp. Ch08]|uniref:Secreted protein n=1 Tax=Singulisphaera sp. Ch08 TaxID=3120278 RepID=A0AAU7CQJ2_9BACT
MTRVHNQERISTHFGLIVPAFCAVILSLLLAHITSPAFSFSQAHAIGHVRVAVRPSLFDESAPRPSVSPSRLGDDGQVFATTLLGHAQLASRIVVVRHFKPAAALDLCGMRIRPQRGLLVQGGSPLRVSQNRSASLHVLLCIWLT